MTKEDLDAMPVQEQRELFRRLVANQDAVELARRLHTDRYTVDRWVRGITLPVPVLMRHIILTLKTR